MLRLSVVNEVSKSCLAFFVRAAKCSRFYGLWTELFLWFQWETRPSDVRSSQLKAAARNLGSNKTSCLEMCCSSGDRSDSPLLWCSHSARCTVQEWGWRRAGWVSLWPNILLGVESCCRVKLLQVSSAVLRNTYYACLIWCGTWWYSHHFSLVLKELRLFLKQLLWFHHFSSVSCHLI